VVTVQALTTVAMAVRVTHGLMDQLMPVVVAAVAYIQALLVQVKVRLAAAVMEAAQRVTWVVLKFVILAHNA
jgi:hypothetical protein